MGYNLYITRKDNWTDEETNGLISMNEWKQVVSADPDMRMDNKVDATVNGKTIRMEEEGIAVWTAYSLAGKNGNQAWFSFDDGMITVKNPDNEIINKMLSIAKVLNAKVQGDDMEIYDEEEYKKEEQKRINKLNKKPWWKF